MYDALVRLFVISALVIGVCYLFGDFKAESPERVPASATAGDELLDF